MMFSVLRLHIVTVINDTHGVCK